ncbi:MAG: lysophospholipid acyltransferase family protein [Rickettsiales bacterium]
MKKLQHFIEAALLKWLFSALAAMSVDMASFTGGLIARALGPFFSANKTAKKNLEMIFPEKTLGERYDIMTKMWDNLGRVAGEFPHLPGEKLVKRVTVHGAENLPQNGETVLFFSGHLGNWELLPAIAKQEGAPTTLVYRHANNAYVDSIIADLRSAHVNRQIAKGPRGAFHLAKALKNQESICMLVDQKMNDGMEVPFFDRPAMTAPAIAQLALHYDLPIIPARTVRKEGAHFDVHILPALQYEKTGDRTKDMQVIMTQINKLLESWIREHPEQWFWVHKRWPIIKV